MSRPDFLKKWASSRPSIPAISDPDYALGFANYLGAIPPSTDDHDYIMNLQDQRAVWLGEQMLNAVGHEWQSDVTYDAYAVVRSPVNGQLYRSLISSNIGNEPSVSGSQWALGVQVDYLNTTRIDVASAATVNLAISAPNTRHINITGTTTITAFTVAIGQTYFVRFAGALTLTNNASIVTQTGANITTQAGDTCIIRATSGNVVEVLSYVPAGGWAKSLGTNGWQKLPSGLIIQWGSSFVTMGVANTLYQTVVNFPIAFPTSCLSANTTPGNCPTSYATTSSENLSVTGFTIVSSIGAGTASPFGLKWIAIGY